MSWNPPWMSRGLGSTGLVTLPVQLYFPHYQNMPPDPRLMKPVVNVPNLNETRAPMINTNVEKPKSGGLWTSVWTGKIGASSPWLRFLGVDSLKYRGRTGWLLSPLPSRVYTVDSKDSMARLLQTHGRFVSGDPSWIYDTRRVIDFEKMSQDYDAMHVTWNAVFDVPEVNYWDLESTLWFRWRFSPEMRHVDLRTGKIKVWKTPR